MDYDTALAAQHAGTKLDMLVNRAHRDTLALIEQADVPSVVKHFDALRNEYRALKDKLTKLENEVNQLSYDLIPTLFDTQSVKSIKIDGVGRVTVNQKWAASMKDKEAGMGWLRQTGNDGLIISTVNSSTLAAFAKTQALEGSPLPSDIFEVGVAPYVSITKS